MLSIADILKPDDLPAHKVEVPEWGGFVYVATLRADERDAMESRLVDLKDAQGLVGVRALMVAFCLCDENGKRLFANDLEAAAEKIGQRAAPGVQRIFNKISDINAVTSGDIEELEKN
jgi:hypothetical protein